MKQNIQIGRLDNKLLNCLSPAGFSHSLQYIWDHPLYIFKGAQVGIPNYVFLYLSILDPEGMPNSKAFHLSLHCLPR